MPLARRRPLTYAANFDPSGWNAAVPSPETITHAITSPVRGRDARERPPDPACSDAGGDQPDRPVPVRPQAEQRLDDPTRDSSAQSTSTAASV